MFAARQFINHGHIRVNGKRVNIASYKLKVGDVVEVKESSKQLAIVLEASQLGERDVPDYVETDHNKMTAKFIRVPQLSDVPYPGSDGTASDRRILFALISTPRVRHERPRIFRGLFRFTATEFAALNRRGTGLSSQQKNMV